MLHTILHRLTTLNAFSIWLLPFYAIYRMGWWLAFNCKRALGPTPLRIGPKVISIGSAEWGGSAKTTLVIEVARYLSGRGKRVAVLSRGYRRATTRVMKVDLSVSNPADLYGDEPALIARAVPQAAIWVGANRAESARRAVESGPTDAVLLDDGLQVVNLEKDFEIVSLDPALSFRFPIFLRQLFLRAPLRLARRADLTIFLGKPAPGMEVRDFISIRYRLDGFTDIESGAPCTVDDLRHQRVVAFCGIARPARFFETLKTAGVDVAEARSFPDHHPFQVHDMDALTSLARKLGAVALVTTQKDAVRVTPRLGGAGAGRKNIRLLAAQTSLEWDPDRALLESKLNALWPS